jgi:hypothetical protein
VRPHASPKTTFPRSFDLTPTSIFHDVSPDNSKLSMHLCPYYIETCPPGKEFKRSERLKARNRMLPAKISIRRFLALNFAI